MLSILILSLTMLAPAHAQKPDTNNPKDQEEKARTRVDGAAGGTGDPLARGDRAKSGMDAGPAHRKGRVHNEKSSDRQAGRGADARHPVQR